MTIKACKGKATVAYVECANCHEEIRRGMWVIAFYEERLVVHEKCYGPVADQIMKLRDELKS